MTRKRTLALSNAQGLLVCEWSVQSLIERMAQMMPENVAQYFKILGDDGKAHIGAGAWHLPQGKRPGKWMPKIVNLRMCSAGYHVVDAEHIIDFLDYGYHIFECEIRGTVLSESDKYCAQQARLLRELQWGEREARLFACDCAERALDLWAKRGTVDERSRNAIVVARSFAVGEATSDDLAAARAAVRDAARAAAWDAERQWQNARLLQYLYGEV